MHNADLIADYNAQIDHTNRISVIISTRSEWFYANKYETPNFSSLDFRREKC